MDIRLLSPDFAVSPQIDASDIPALVQAGYRTIICNRPDAEVPPSHHAKAIEAAATAAGLSFHYLPVTHQDLTQDLVDAQFSLMEQAEGPVFAYCASGTRSSIVWSYGMAKSMDADAIIAATTAAGYDLGGIRSALQKIAASG